MINPMRNLADAYHLTQWPEMLLGDWNIHITQKTQVPQISWLVLVSNGWRGCAKLVPIDNVYCILHNIVSCLWLTVSTISPQEKSKCVELLPGRNTNTLISVLPHGRKTHSTHYIPPHEKPKMLDFPVGNIHKHCQLFWHPSMGTKQKYEFPLGVESLTPKAADRCRWDHIAYHHWRFMTLWYMQFNAGS